MDDRIFLSKLSLGFLIRADQEGWLQRSAGAEEHPQGCLQRPFHPLPGKGELSWASDCFWCGCSL